MGRTMKRVPMDFDHPINEVWGGYVNPHYKKCPAASKNECHGGYNNDGMWMDAICRFLALVGEQAVSTPYAEQLRARGQTFPHPYLQEFAQAPRTDIPHEVRARIMELKSTSERASELYEYRRQHPAQLLPFGDEMVGFITKLAGRKPDPPFGGNLEWYIRNALLRTAGIDTDGPWGTCRVCEGDGMDPAVKQDYEAWSKTEPPDGPGYQLWETTTEGSPVSPVFATLDELCQWCESNARTFGPFKASAAEWKQMLEADSVVHQEGSMVFM